ncbi:MAG: tRNA (adenosine(37)-N6)-threonylcarbamoyltransferase complex transferase subunit TsaD, partial [Muribaculaceae bacterium]|nr:tRNA (adenosine(37)-N6)-threonylcarbamoyltransferase complex transferase subunit TsaD [Muribaculaceae bacterium]
LYTVRDGVKANPEFIRDNLPDLAASLQATIIEILTDKLAKAPQLKEVRHVAIGGGVSANSGVRDAIQKFCDCRGIKAWIPERAFTTDNAAMVAAAGYFKFLKGEYCDLSLPPYSRVSV